MSYLNKIVTQFDPSNMSAFGTLEASELTPVIQGDWVYGINTQLWNTPVTSGTGASVDTNASRLRIQSGTDSAGYAYITSRKIVRYRAGQGVLFRITPIFTAGAADNIQLWGCGNIASNAPQDGYFFGVNGIAPGIVHYNGGTPTWTAQTSWNGDKCNGSAGTSFNWNPAYGTPAMIKYPYLGFGDIEFFLQNPSTGRWILVHTIQYANTTNLVQLGNPSLHIVGYTKNSGNTSNIILYSGSVGAFISGTRNFSSNPRRAIDNNKSSITAETSLFGLRNCTTYNGVANKGMIRLNALSAAVSTNNTLIVIRLRIGASIGGSPSYAPINGSTANSGVTITAGNSISSFDTAGTTSTGGTYIFNMALSTSSASVDLTPLELFVSPGEILTVAAFASASSSVVASLNWSEDI